MSANKQAALQRLRDEMEQPPFPRVLQPQAVDVDPESGTVTIALAFRDELARAPNEKSFHGGVVAPLIDVGGHAAVAVKIGRMAPTIDLRIDYLRPSSGENVTAQARLIKAGRIIGRVDVDLTDKQGPSLRSGAEASARLKVSRRFAGR